MVDWNSKHDEEMERAVAEAHAPRGVPAAGLAQIPYVLGRQLLERAEVDVVDPVRADRAQQVAHHVREAEEPFTEQTPKGACDRGAWSVVGRCGLGPEAARRKRRAPVPSGCEVPDRLWGVFVDRIVHLPPP